MTLSNALNPKNARRVKYSRSFLNATTASSSSSLFGNAKIKKNDLLLNTKTRPTTTCHHFMEFKLLHHQRNGSTFWRGARPVPNNNNSIHTFNCFHSISSHTHHHHHHHNINRCLSSWAADMIPPFLQNFTIWGGSGFVLKTIHTGGGAILIPYWACISITNIAVRLSLFPLVIDGAKTSIRFAKVAPEVQFLMTLFQKEMTMMKEKGATPEQHRNHVWINFTTLRGIYKIHGINPLAVFKSPLLQLPVFWYFAVDLRKIINGLDPELANDLTEGGFWWLTNLTDPDPWFSLPILSGGLMYLNIELAMGKHNLSGEATSKSNVSMLVKDGFQTLSLFIPSFMATSPAGTQVYLATTFVFTLVQSAALRNDAFRGLVGLPSKNEVPKSHAPLAKEFMSLIKKEKEAADAREKNEYSPSVGTGVLAPGFTAAFVGNNISSSIKVEHKDTNVNVDNSNDDSSHAKKGNIASGDDAKVTTPNKVIEVSPSDIMDAANKGAPMPKPIIIPPKVETNKNVMGKEDVASSLKKKKSSIKTKKRGKK